MPEMYANRNTSSVMRCGGETINRICPIKTGSLELIRKTLLPW